MTGARFTVSFGAGALLERALIFFMLDLHTREHGYREVLPPFVVNRGSLTGTGQLAKFEQDRPLPSGEVSLLPGADRRGASCSNCTDFQARRANLRYRPEGGGKPRLLHTLNGSGLAVGRTLIAILENYQEEDGSVTVPEILRPYAGGLERIAATG